MNNKCLCSLVAVLYFSRVASSTEIETDSVKNVNPFSSVAMVSESSTTITTSDTVPIEHVKTVATDQTSNKIKEKFQGADCDTCKPNDQSSDEEPQQQTEEDSLKLRKEKDSKEMTITGRPEQPSVQFKKMVQGETIGSKVLEAEVMSEREADETSEKDKDFETFTEWKQKTLAEEQEKSTINDEGIANNKPSLKKQKKNNYASKECGAKVLAHNPEAENADRVLTSSKDDYMINPCKAKKWFIVELCEPVHVKSVEISSLELFSSQPKSFKLSFSDRYPSKEWQNSQQFQLIEERSLQSFEIDFSDDYYVKYIKVEMMEHYGEEHFCPLTTFKLFGIPVELDDYDSPHDEDSDNDIDAAILNNGEENSDCSEPKTLVHSVKESVMKIVKKVLNVGDKAMNLANETRTQNDTTGNGTVSNLTAGNQLLPCAPEASVSAPTTKAEGPDLSKGSVKPAAPDASSDQIIPLPCVVPSLKDEEMKPPVLNPDVSIVIKLEDHEQMPSEGLKDQFVTLLHSGDNNSMREIFADCFGMIFTNSTRLRCVYFRLMTRQPVLHMCPMQKEIGSVKENFCKKGKDRYDPKIEMTGKVNLQVVQKLEHESSKSKSLVIDSTFTPELSLVTEVKKQEEQNVAKDKEIPTESVNIAVATEVKTGNAKEILADEEKHGLGEYVIRDGEGGNMKHYDILTSVVDAQDIHSTASSTVPLYENMKSETMKYPKEMDNYSSAVFHVSLQPISSQKEPENGALLQETPSLKASPTDVQYGIGSKIESFPSQEQIDSRTIVEQTQIILGSSSPKQQLPEVNIPSIITAPFEISTQSVDESTAIGESVVNDLNLSETRPHEQAEMMEVQETITFDRSSPQHDLDLVSIPVMPLQKRETAIMRLTNRIKVLETNVSLSSRFLDQMTQKFKKQSNETLKLLNARFENLTKEAEMRDQRQQVQISFLEDQLQNLTNMVTAFQDEIRIIRKQMTDRQMIWTSIEIFILCIIFLVCVQKRQCSESIIRPEVQRLIDTMPTTMALSSYENVRRNSFSGATESTQNVTVGTTLQKHSSDTALAEIKSYWPCLHSEELNENAFQSKSKESAINRKKKKKKRSSEVKFAPVLKKSEKICASDLQLGCQSAGLLFGSVTTEPKDKESSQNRLSRSKSDAGFRSFSEDISESGAKRTFEESAVNMFDTKTGGIESFVKLGSVSKRSLGQKCTGNSLKGFQNYPNSKRTTVCRNTERDYDDAKDS